MRNTLLFCLICISFFCFNKPLIASDINQNQTKQFGNLIANPFEERNAFIYQSGSEQLRMDIGKSFDLANIYDNQERRINFGVDLMTFTRLRSEGRMKFPVETTDYYFGVNFSHIGNIFLNGKKGQEAIRLRIAHISSHLIDGYTENNQFLKNPFVFSREFVELVYKINNGLPFYFGINYIFSSLPKNINSLELIAGAQISRKIINDFSLVSAYNFQLKGIDDKYFGVHSVQLGLDYEMLQNRSLFFGLYAYHGLSMHGMFFYEKDSYIGVGIQVNY